MEYVLFILSGVFFVFLFFGENGRTRRGNNMNESFYEHRQRSRLSSFPRPRRRARWTFYPVSYCSIGATTRRHAEFLLPQTYHHHHHYRFAIATVHTVYCRYYFETKLVIAVAFRVWITHVVRFVFIANVIRQNVCLPTKFVRRSAEAYKTLWTRTGNVIENEPHEQIITIIPYYTIK